MIKLKLSYAVRSMLLRALVNRVTIKAPTTLYLGLGRSLANSVGLSLDEPEAPCYARARIGDPEGTFGRPFLGGVSNVHPIALPCATAEWGPIRSVFLADGPGRDARILASADLPRPEEVPIGNVPYFAQGSIGIDLGS